MLTVTIFLFLAGISMGIAGALIWAWGVRVGQFRDLEASKHQIFWPDIAPSTTDAAGTNPQALSDSPSERTPTA